MPKPGFGRLLRLTGRRRREGSGRGKHRGGGYGGETLGRVRQHEQVRSGLTAGLVASVTAAIAIPVPATIDRIKPVRPLDRRAMLVKGR